MPIRSATSNPPRTNTRDGSTGHQVLSGETLGGIAAQHGVSLQAMLGANPQLRTPDRLQVGQQLNLPGDHAAGANTSGSHRPVEDRFYVVGPGDTLSHIALDLGVSVGDLLDANPQVHDPRHIRPDDRLRLPLQASSRGALGALNAHSSFNATVPVIGGVPTYAPNSRAAIQLFTEAAELAGVPASWARSPGLHNILERESQGRVGVLNSTYGSRSRDPSRWPEVHRELRGGRITARSSATGLGQLRLDNVDAYYPNGRAGIGDPLQEAAGMLSYIKARYRTPERAWQLYGTRHEGYEV